MIKKTLFIAILILPSCNIFNKEDRLSNLGFKAFSKQDYPSAISYFSKSIELNNFDYYSFKMRGLAYGLQSKYDSALMDIIRCNLINIITSQEILEERFTICKDSYLAGMMSYYLHKDDDALQYLKVSISFNPMEIVNWNKAIEKRISKDFEFNYDMDYTSLYLECLILSGKLCMENNRTTEALYYFYKAKDIFRLKRTPYLMLQQASISLGDSIGSEAVIKEYDHLLNSISEKKDINVLSQIELQVDSSLHNFNSSQYEEDRKKISFGIIQVLQSQNPRFDIDSIYSLEQ